ncbi:hypothetical protein HRbin01_00106 [archaeon HR01]|nr:hypothetical protein HRbin01_00106 [archaeon HR01]
MTREEIVYLDTLNGYEFEKLCAQIFTKLGWGEVEDVQDVWDEGRDLLIKTPHGELWVVECKHQPGNSIGRPIVQKLHSAVISSNAQMGILITTGGFSQAAIEYARKISNKAKIELIDMLKLIDLADRAGIKIITTSATTPYIFTYGYSKNIEHLIKKLNIIYDRFLSHPFQAIEILKIKPIKLDLKPLVYVKYDIHANFQTTVGIVHTIHETDKVLFIDGSDGQILNKEISSFLIKSNLSRFEQESVLPCPITRENLNYRLDTIIKIAKQHIIQKHTTTVAYYGRNKVRYVKTCRPNERHIHIRDVKLVLMPSWFSTFYAFRQKYNCFIVENDHGIIITSTDIFNCRVCGKEILTQALLCNNCGNVTHTPRIFRSHGFICKKCGKTICRNCAFWMRRLLFFKRILCETCAGEHDGKKRKLSS